MHQILWRRVASRALQGAVLQVAGRVFTGGAGSAGEGAAAAAAADGAAAGGEELLDAGGGGGAPSPSLSSLITSCRGAEGIIYEGPTELPM